MITRSDIAYFYEQYMKNLDEETEIANSILHAENESEWISAVYNRKERMISIFNNNKELMDKYLNDFLSEKVKLNREQAVEFLNQITEFAKNGYYDLCAGVFMLKIVEQFFAKTNDRDNLIRTINVLGALHMLNSFDNDTRISLQYSQLLTEYTDVYHEIEDWEVRRTVLLSWLNYCISLTNGREIFSGDIVAGQKEIMDAYAKSLEFYSRADIRERDGDKLPLDELLGQLEYILFGNWLAAMENPQDILPEFLELAASSLSVLYHKEANQGMLLHDMNDEVYCYFWVSEFLTGKTSIHTMVTKIYAYCKAVLENIPLEMDENFYMTKYFRVVMYHLPYLLKYLSYKGVGGALRDEVIQYTFTNFLGLLSKMPLFRSSSIINKVIIESSMIIVKHLPMSISPFSFLQRVFVARDESIMLHANMVRQLALIISERMFSLRPELFLGLYESQYVADVLKNQDDIMELIRQSASLFDIGMFEYSVLVQKTGRPLSKAEKEYIKGHCEAGYNMISRFNVMNGIPDVVLGHHKSYDGKNGYPVDFDNTKSPFRIIIDIIKICDDMDAATDFISRTYKNPISFSDFVRELQEGAGTKYNPNIVNLIVSDKKLSTRLSECCETGRDRAYYSVYNEFYNKNVAEPENNSGRLKNGWFDTFSAIFEVNLFKDQVTVIQQKPDNDLKITNGSFSKIIDYHVKNIFHPDDWKTVSFLSVPGALPDRLYLHQGAVEFEVRVKQKTDNTYRWNRFQFFVVEEKYGIAGKVLVFVSDVDEQKRQSILLEQSLEHARQEAKSANLAKSMFISNISHEIRTPMNAIVGMTEILLRENLTDIQREYLENIKSSGNALISLINDILDFSKMESGKLEIVNDTYSIMSIINDISLIFLNRIGEKPIELLFDIDKNMPDKLYGDALRLRQVIINLVNNAIKFTDEGFIKLTVKVGEIKGNDVKLIVSVEDSGTGIKEEDVEKLFGEFAQLDIRRNHEKEGTGLGLVISKQLIELMGGKLSVKSKYGVGSTFSFDVIHCLEEEKKNGEIKSISGNIELATILKPEHKDVKVGGLTNDYVSDNLKSLCDEFGVTYFDLKDEDHQVDFVFSDYENLQIAKDMFPDADKTKICLIYNPMIENINDERAKIVNKPIYSLNFCQVLNNETDRQAKMRDDDIVDFIAPDARILIVDDTMMNLKVARGLLTPIGMHIETADSGMEALKILEKRTFDLIFMDHKMPGMDGVETTERIRAMQGEYYKTIPIIALTANAVLSARDMFKAAGMNDFVAKPIEMKDICYKLKKWLPADKIQKKPAQLFCDLKDKQIFLENDFSDLPQIDSIDYKEGVKNSGSKKLLTSLLCDFYRMVDTKRSKIKQYIDERLIKEYVVEVHALKNVCRLIGAIELSEKFKSLEKAGDAGNIQYLSEKTEKVLDEYLELKEKLKEFVLNKEDMVEKKAVEKDILLSTLADIATSMENFDIDSVDELMSKMETYKLPQELMDSMDKLRMYVSDVAIEEVIQVVDEMMAILKN